jgi:hypothetical protein
VAALPTVPVADLEAANLGSASNLVTPLRMAASDGSGQVLIGAYADPTRTVLFFTGKSVAPGPGTYSTMSVFDSHGFLNAGTSARRVGSDSFYALDLGPRPDSDGLAHITVTNGPPGESLTAPPPSTGWAFRFALKIQSATPLPAAAALQLGSWKVTIEDLSVTPSVIDFQAVIAGASNVQVMPYTVAQPITLFDSAGNPISPISADAGITVPKLQLNAQNYKNTRVHIQWARPATATTYTLRLAANGVVRIITLQIPAA